MSDEPDIIAESVPYPEWADENEQRRAYIFAQLAPLEYDARVKIEEAQAWYEWITESTMPVKETRGRKLQEVK